MMLHALTVALARFRADQPADTRVAVVCPPAVETQVRAAALVLDPTGDIITVSSSPLVQPGDVYVMRHPDEVLALGEVLDPTLRWPRPLSGDCWWLELETLAVTREIARLGGPE